MVKIVDIQITDVLKRLEDSGVTITLTQRAKTWVADIGYDADFGARPLKRAIQRYVESPLSVKLLRDEFKKGDHIMVDEQDGELVFELKSAEIIDLEPQPA